MACPHNNVQQYTEICLDCGVGIYESEAERVARLRREVSSLRQEVLKSEGDQLEAERDRLRKILQPEPDPQDFGW